MAQAYKTVSEVVDGLDSYDRYMGNLFRFKYLVHKNQLNEVLEDLKSGIRFARLRVSDKEVNRHRYGDDMAILSSVVELKHKYIINITNTIDNWR